MMSVISIAIVKYSAQNCFRMQLSTRNYLHTAVLNYHVKYSYAGHCESYMLNINAICNVLFFIYIRVVKVTFDESVEESNVEARLNALLNTLGHLLQSFYQLIALTLTSYFFLLLSTGCLKKRNPNLACHCALITRCINVIFHNNKDQAFGY